MVKANLTGRQRGGPADSGNDISLNSVEAQDILKLVGVFNSRYEETGEIEYLNNSITQVGALLARTVRDNNLLSLFGALLKARYGQTEALEDLD